MLDSIFCMPVSPEEIKQCFCPALAEASGQRVSIIRIGLTLQPGPGQRHHQCPKRKKLPQLEYGGNQLGAHLEHVLFSSLLPAFFFCLEFAVLSSHSNLQPPQQPAQSEQPTKLRLSPFLFLRGFSVASLEGTTIDSSLLGQRHKKWRNVLQAASCMLLLLLATSRQPSS
ncbi:hypothetical protein ACLKA6_017544 [Drosophila palustris]